MPAPNLDALAPRGVDKSEVNYRQHESCKTCIHFNGRVYCAKVIGHVSPDCICSLWTLREEPVGITGKEIIMNAYEKSKGGG